jgi:hypothetical protein
VRVVERGASGREKRVDTGVVARVCRDAYLLGQPGRDRITLVVGDCDYEPMVRQLVQDSSEATLLYWSHVSRELQAVASRFCPINRYLQELTLADNWYQAARPGTCPQIRKTELSITGGLAGPGKRKGGCT